MSSGLPMARAYSTTSAVPPLPRAASPSQTAMQQVRAVDGLEPAVEVGVHSRAALGADRTCSARSSSASTPRQSPEPKSFENSVRGSGRMACQEMPRRQRLAHEQLVAALGHRRQRHPLVRGEACAGSPSAAPMAPAGSPGSSSLPVPREAHDVEHGQLAVAWIRVRHAVDAQAPGLTLAFRRNRLVGSWRS